MVHVETPKSHIESEGPKRTPEEMEARLQQLHMYLCIHKPGLSAARERLSNYEESFIPVYEEMEGLLEELGRELPESEGSGKLAFSPDRLPEGRFALEALIRITDNTLDKAYTVVSEAEALHEAAIAKRDQLLNGPGIKDSDS